MILYKIVFNKDLDITSNVILGMLYHLRNKKLYNNVICKSLGISERTLQRKYIELEQKGYINISKKWDVKRELCDTLKLLTGKTLNIYKEELKPYKQTKYNKGVRVMEVPSWYENYKKELEEKEKKEDTSNQTTQEIYQKVLDIFGNGDEENDYQ